MDGHFMSDTVPIIESDMMTSQTASYGLNETSPDRGATSPEDVDPVIRQKRWRLCCRSSSCVLTFLCIAALGQSMSVNGLIGVTLSTIQRRFNLSSSQTAWITSAYEVAGIPALLIVGYIGSKIRRPLWIASGLVILNIGIFVYTIPHYITDPNPITSPNSSQLCSTSGPTDSCHTADFSAAVGVNRYLSLFVVASVLMGIGSVPLFVLGVTYIDDSATHHSAAFYLGVFYSMSVFGPVLAFIGGGFLLEVYDDFDRVDVQTVTINSSDQNWIGAWWLGYLVSFTLVFVSIPFTFSFPDNPPVATTKVLPVVTSESRSTSAEDVSTTTSSTVQSRQQLQLSENVTPIKDDDDDDVRMTLNTSWREIPRCVLRLLTNWPYLFSALYGTCDAMLIDGFQTFGPAYLQQQFGLTPTLAGIVFGLIAVPGGAGGFLVGSYLIKRFSLTSSTLLRLMFFLSAACLVLMLAFTIQCDTSPFVGVTDVKLHSTGNSLDRYKALNVSCNSRCSCNPQQYDPVCGSDGLTYFSACYAGCSSGSRDEGYYACSCIFNETLTTSYTSGAQQDNNATTVEASLGVCSNNGCQMWKLALFVIVFLMAMFTVFVCAIFHVSVILRVVEHSERPLSYAVDWMLQRLVGAMPGPVLFGYVLDHSCLLWTMKCDNSRSCLYYDNHQMAWLMMAVCVSCKALNVLFGFIAWRLYAYRNSKKPLSTSLTAAEFCAKKPVTASVVCLSGFSRIENQQEMQSASSEPNTPTTDFTSIQF